MYSLDPPVSEDFTAVAVVEDGLTVVEKTEVLQGAVSLLVANRQPGVFLQALLMVLHYDV